MRDVFEVGVVVFGFNVKASVRLYGDDCATTLAVFLEDAGVGKIVGAHTVGEADILVTLTAVVEDGEVVVVVVATEDALESAFKTGFKERARLHTAVDTPSLDAVFVAGRAAQLAPDRAASG